MKVKKVKKYDAGYSRSELMQENMEQVTKYEFVPRVHPRSEKELEDEEALMGDIMAMFDKSRFNL